MDIINAQVRHNKYGIGAVIEQADNVITVEFPHDGGKKKFLYPTIFEQHLTLCSEEMQAKQAEEITQRRANDEASQAQKLAEDEQRRREEKAAQKAAKKMHPVRRKQVKSKASDGQ